MKTYKVETLHSCYVGQIVKIVPNGKDYTIREQSRYGYTELIDNKGKAREIRSDRIVYIVIPNVGD